MVFPILVQSHFLGTVDAPRSLRRQRVVTQSTQDIRMAVAHRGDALETLG